MGCSVCQRPIAEHTLDEAEICKCEIYRNTSLAELEIHIYELTPRAFCKCCQKIEDCREEEFNDGGKHLVCKACIEVCEDCNGIVKTLEIPNWQAGAAQLMKNWRVQ